MSLGTNNTLEQMYLLPPEQVLCGKVLCGFLVPLGVSPEGGPISPDVGPWKATPILAPVHHDSNGPHGEETLSEQQNTRPVAGGSVDLLEGSTGAAADNLWSECLLTSQT